MHAAARVEAASSAPSNRLQSPARKRAEGGGGTEKDTEAGGRAEEQAEGASRATLAPKSLQKMEGAGLERDQWLWLQRQRVLWRLGKLPETRVRLIYAAGAPRFLLFLHSWGMVRRPAP